MGILARDSFVRGRVMFRAPDTGCAGYTAPALFSLIQPEGIAGDRITERHFNAVSDD